MQTLYAAAKSLQSCPTLCDPIDGSPPGYPVPEILQATTLEWVPIAFSGRLSIQAAKTRPAADCGSDHELLTAKFRIKLKRVGNTTRPFGYDLNQINYNYTVEVRDRFKGLDLIGRMSEEQWMEVHDIAQEAGIKTILEKKKCKETSGHLRRPFK